MSRPHYRACENHILVTFQYPKIGPTNECFATPKIDHPILLYHLVDQVSTFDMHGFGKKKTTVQYTYNALTKFKRLNAPIVNVCAVGMLQ